MKGVSLTPALVARLQVPSSLQAMAELCGRMPVWRLILAHGGRKIRIPVNERRSALVKVVGFEGVRALQTVFQPGECVPVPTGRTALVSATAQMMAEAGRSSAEIQRHLGLSASQTRRIIAGIARGTPVATQVDAPDKPLSCCPCCGQKIKRRRRLKPSPPSVDRLTCSAVPFQLHLTGVSTHD